MTNCKRARLRRRPTENPQAQHLTYLVLFCIKQDSSMLNTLYFYTLQDKKTFPITSQTPYPIIICLYTIAKYYQYQEFPLFYSLKYRQPVEPYYDKMFFRKYVPV